MGARIALTNSGPPTSPPGKTLTISTPSSSAREISDALDSESPEKVIWALSQESKLNRLQAEVNRVISRAEFDALSAADKVDLMRNGWRLE